MFRKPLFTSLMLLLLACGLKAAFDKTDPTELLSRAKQLLVSRATASEIMRPLNAAINLYQERKYTGLEYAQALEMRAMLLRRWDDPSQQEWTRKVMPSVETALQIAGAQSNQNSGDLALALELKADILGRKGPGTAFWRNAGEIRAAHVAAVQSEREQIRSGQIARDEKGITPPRISHKVEPNYPELARQAGLECAVAVISIVIDANGIPGQFHLLKGCGYGFDEEGAAAVKQWRFYPAERAGIPVASAASVEVNFKLIADSNDSPVRQKCPTGPASSSPIL